MQCNVRNKECAWSLLYDVSGRQQRAVCPVSCVLAPLLCASTRYVGGPGLGPTGLDLY